MSEIRNVTAKVQGAKLVLEIDISKAAVAAAPMSGTGKTRLLASTAGAMPVSCAVEGLKVALNVMIPLGA